MAAWLLPILKAVAGSAASSLLSSNKKGANEEEIPKKKKNLYQESVDPKYSDKMFKPMKDSSNYLKHVDRGGKL